MKSEDVKVYAHRIVNDSSGVHSEMIETFLGKWVKLEDFDTLSLELRKAKSEIVVLRKYLVNYPVGSLYMDKLDAEIEAARAEVK